ncbi:MAG: hypothetical protein HC904_08700 [Blastochloris sp.]|nr:hypothetical protein [Blastochloris sp.]
MAKTLKAISHFDFSEWKKIGSGSGAELQAGKELMDELRATIDPEDEQQGTLKV